MALQPPQKKICFWIATFISFELPLTPVALSTMGNRSHKKKLALTSFFFFFDQAVVTVSSNHGKSVVRTCSIEDKVRIGYSRSTIYWFDFSDLLGLHSFKSVQTIESIYTGGKVALAADEQWLITSIGEDIDVTEFDTGKKVYRLKGVSSYAACCYLHCFM
jgi:hypothetical protein